MSINERKKLAKYLKHGDLKLIAAKAKISTGTVSNWINGRFEKSGCAPYFEKLAMQRKAEVENTNM